MHQNLTIALDAMGGDHGPDVVIPAALDCIERNPGLNLILVGDEAAIRSRLGSPRWGDRLSLRHASQVVEMHELPSRALRTKKDSSMRVAIDLVKQGVASACVSAGNTGALMATAKFVLKTIPGIDRPAIIATLPSKGGYTYVLDLGANVDCTAEHLYQFAIMGHELVCAVEDKTAPRLGLLNVGEEEIKGNEQVKQAARLLAASHVNFIGFVEGNDIFSESVDIVVTDGFVGNIALKTTEGLAKMIGGSLKAEFEKTIWSRLAGLAALPILKSFKRQYDPRRYNGASLVGLTGIVIKSHGNADRLAFANAIHIAVKEVEKAVPSRIGERLTERLSEGKVA